MLTLSCFELVIALIIYSAHQLWRTSSKRSAPTSWSDQRCVSKYAVFCGLLQHWIPVSRGRPWHAQIHRDAFAYGDAAPNVDQRMIVDLRFFGIVEQHHNNRVEFATCWRLKNDAQRGITDIMGMPQPTFHYSYTAEEKLRMVRRTYLLDPHF